MGIHTNVIEVDVVLGDNNTGSALYSNTGSYPMWDFNLVFIDVTSVSGVDPDTQFTLSMPSVSAIVEKYATEDGDTVMFVNNNAINNSFKRNDQPDAAFYNGSIISDPQMGTVVRVRTYNDDYSTFPSEWDYLDIMQPASSYGHNEGDYLLDTYSDGYVDRAYIVQGGYYMEQNDSYNYSYISGGWQSSVYYFYSSPSYSITPTRSIFITSTDETSRLDTSMDGYLTVYINENNQLIQKCSLQ